MKILRLIIIIVLAALGLAAGIAKLMATAHEVAFFAQFGLGQAVVVAVGAIQALGAAGLVFVKVRLLAAILTVACFGASSLMIFATGDFAFGAASLLPVGLSLYVVRWAKDTSDADLA